MKQIVFRFCICITAVCALKLHAEDLVFFGNLHSHTSYSDGTGTPSQAYKHARDAAKLEFLAITEHNHRLAESGASDDRKDGFHALGARFARLAAADGNPEAAGLHERRAVVGVGGKLRRRQRE